MATLSGTLYGDNATLRDSNVPSEKIDVTENGGRVRVLFDSYTVPSADELGTSAVVNMMKIPKGARVLDVEANAPASGATGEAKIGWAAGANGDEAADDDGFYTSDQFDPGDAAIDRKKIDSSRPGFQKTFTEEVQVQIAVSEITADSGGDTWDLTVYYTID